jgi:ABC-2 type transport system ATP-binding protein
MAPQNLERAMVNAIEVKDLTRLFGGKKTVPSVALDHLDLEVREGELFGLLGPNGAGKTTLIKILSTLLLPTSGTAKVLGYDVVKDASRIRPRINMVSGGETSGYGLLTVRENLWMFSQFYGIPGREAKATIEELLVKFDLLDKGDAKVRTISTGQRQKMNVVRGFVTDPDLLYLDEPTLGLDVNASLIIREYLRGWVKEKKGKTLLLTTHYMVEADELCDRVAIIDKGRILACDSPRNLKKMISKNSTFSIETTPFADFGGLSSIPGITGVSAETAGGHTVMKLVTEDESAISDIISFLAQHNARIISLNKNEATLEDVFIKMVGRGLE